MADASPEPDTGQEPSGGASQQLTTGTPLWVKVFGIIALVVILVFVVLLVTGRGGEHGPSRHGAATPPAHVPEYVGHTRPPGVTYAMQQP